MDIVFKADLENGEAHITKHMEAKVVDLDPLLRADLLKDVVGMAQRLYNQALTDLRADWESKRAKALAKEGIQ